MESSLGVEDVFGVPPLSDEDRRLLDVARSLFVTYGFKKTTIDDIVREAGVTRRTVNRRLGDKNRIVRTVVAREVTDFFTRTAVRLIGLPTPSERTVEAFAAGVVEFQTNEVAQAILRLEPETFVALLSKGSETSWGQIRDAVALGLLGSGRDLGEARRMTELILRITGSLLVAPTSYLPLKTEEDARWFARSVFVPIVEGGIPAPDRS